MFWYGRNRAVGATRQSYAELFHRDVSGRRRLRTCNVCLLLWMPFLFPGWIHHVVCSYIHQGVVTAITPVELFATGVKVQSKTFPVAIKATLNEHFCQLTI